MQEAGHRSPHRVGVLPRARLPSRESSGGEGDPPLPPRAPGAKPRGLPEPAHPLVPRVHRRLLLQAAHRRRAAREASRRPDRPVRLPRGRHSRGDPRRSPGACPGARPALPGAFRPRRVLPRGPGSRHPRAEDREQGAGGHRAGDGHSPGGHERRALHAAGRRARAGHPHLHRHRQEGVRGQADEVRVPRVLLQERGRDGRPVPRDARGDRQHREDRGGVQPRDPRAEAAVPRVRGAAGPHARELPHGAGPPRPGGALRARARRRGGALHLRAVGDHLHGIHGVLPRRLGLHPLRPRERHRRRDPAGARGSARSSPTACASPTWTR